MNLQSHYLDKYQMPLSAKKITHFGFELQRECSILKIFHD